MYPLSKHHQRQRRKGKMLTMSQINDIKDLSKKGYNVSKNIYTVESAVAQLVALKKGVSDNA